MEAEQKKKLAVVAAIGLVLGFGYVYYQQTKPLTQDEANQLTQTALGSENNPQKLRDLATRLRSQGFTANANLLEQKATSIEGGNALLSSAGKGGGVPVVKPSTPTPTPGGGVQVNIPGVGTVSIPPSLGASVNSGTYVVTTNDPPPSGNLNARDAANGTIIGYYPKGGTVQALDPNPTSGFLKVHGPGFTNANEPVADLIAWASAAYLKPQGAGLSV